MSWLIIGKWILGNGKLLAVGAVVLALIGLLWSWDSRGDRVEKLEREADGWNNAVTTLDGALKRNKKDIAECESINVENASEIGRLKTDIAESKARVDTINLNAETVIAGYRDEANELRGRDTTCRTLDDDLPEWLVSGVRKPTAADNH